MPLNDAERRASCRPGRRTSRRAPARRASAARSRTTPTASARRPAASRAAPSPTFLTSVRYAPFDTTTSVALIRSPGARPSSCLRVLHLVGHRHRRHEALDLFVLDRSTCLLVGVDRQDLALQRDTSRSVGRLAARGERAPGSEQNAPASKTRCERMHIVYVVSHDLDRHLRLQLSRMEGQLLSGRSRRRRRCCRTTRRGFRPSRSTTRSTGCRTRSSCRGWAAQTPSPYKLTLKAPRRITHDSRLKNCRRARRRPSARSPARSATSSARCCSSCRRT